MPPILETIIFDSSGDVFLLLEKNDVRTNRQQSHSSEHGNIDPPDDETPADEVSANEAKPGSGNAPATILHIK